MVAGKPLALPRGGPREYAVMVMRIGYQIALSPPDGAEARPDWSALSDVWREHVLPHAVAR